MAWSGTQGSAIFYQAMKSPFLQKVSGGTSPTGYTSLTADAIKCALFLGTNTPNKTDTLANSAYNQGQWVSATYEASGAGYTAGGGTGGTLAGLAIGNDATNTNEFYYTSTNPSWTTVTLTAVYGDLVYDSSITAGTVNQQAFCFNYFGGSQSITAGTFTVQWPTPGGGTTACFLDFTV